MTNDELIQKIASQRPEPPEGFEGRQDALLRRLTKKEERKMKKKISLGLVIALALLMTAVIATAEMANFGLVDFFQNNLFRDAPAESEAPPDISPEALRLIHSQIPLSFSPNAYASFEIREAAYDGTRCYLVLAAKPLKEDIFLLPDTMSADRCLLLPIQREGQEAFTGTTPYFHKDNALEYVGEYALRTGKQLVSLRLYPSPSSNIAIYVRESDCLWEADGTLVMMASFAVEEGTENLSLEMPIDLCQYVYDGELPIEQYYAEQVRQRDPAEHFSSAYRRPGASKTSCSLFFQLNYTAPLWQVQAAVPIHAQSANLTITHLQITTTPFATYIDMNYEWPAGDSSSPRVFHIAISLDGEEPLNPNLSLGANYTHNYLSLSGDERIYQYQMHSSCQVMAEIPSLAALTIDAYPVDDIGLRGPRISSDHISLSLVPISSTPAP